MKPVLVNGELWRVERVPPTDPLLIDRTGTLTHATTDPVDRVIRISNSITPPFLDMVLLHEISHAITISHGLLDDLRSTMPPDLWVLAEEWAASLMEKHSVEAAIITSQALGRPLCVGGFCT